MSSVRALTSHAAPRARSTVPHSGFILVELALAGVFALLTFAIWRHPGPLPDDVALEQTVQHDLLHRGPLTAILEAVSTLNFPTPVAITLAVLVVLFALMRRWLDILVVVATLAVADGTQAIVSKFVHRPRPSGHGLHIVSVIKGSYAFPSGHVTYAVAIFGLLLFLTCQIRRPIHPVVLWAIRVVLAVLIVAMPISRVLEGEHWPSDVLGGILYGAFWLIIATHVYLWARRRWPVLLARDERGGTA